MKKTMIGLFLATAMLTASAFAGGECGKSGGCSKEAQATCPAKTAACDKALTEKTAEKSADTQKAPKQTAKKN